MLFENGLTWAFPGNYRFLLYKDLARWRGLLQFSWAVLRLQHKLDVSEQLNLNLT